MKQLSEKIKKAFLENKLIGNCYFDEKEYSKLINYVYFKCNDLVASRDEKFFPSIDYQIIFTTLVQIASRWKSNYRNDRSFWKYVSRVIFGDDVSYDSKLYHAFTHIISTLGTHQKLPIAESGQKYYTTIMMHSFSPQSSIHSFFDLCYNIYKKDLDFGFTASDEWVCEIVFLQLRNALGKNYTEDNLVSIGSSTYSIKAGIRTFVLNENLSVEFIQFIKNTFSNINKLFNREIIDKKTSLDYSIIEWWRNKIETDKHDKKTTINKRMPTVSKQNICIKYLNTNNGVFLCIPSIRLENATDKIELTVFVENRIVYCEELPTKCGELVIATKPKEFELNNLLINVDLLDIGVAIKENGAIVFDSERSKATSLYREFLLFNGEIEVYSQINKPTNYFVYSKDIDSLKECPEDVSTCGRNLYNIYPVAGENLIGKIKQAFFVNNDRSSNWGETASLIGDFVNVEWVLNDTHYLVYKNAIKLMIPESWNLKALELRIDEKQYKLQELNYERIELGCYQYGLKVLNLISESYPVNISLYSYEKEHILLEKKIILLPNLGVHFNAPFYYGDIERKVIIEYNNQVIEHTWCEGESEIIYPICNGSLVIKVPYLKWRINDGDWHSESIIKKKWYKEFVKNGDLLEVECSKEDERFFIYAKINGDIYPIAKNINGKFEFGRAIYSNENNTSISIYINDGREDYFLLEIATKEHFVSSPIIINGLNLYLNINDTFIGDNDNDLYIIVKNKNKDSVRKKVRIENIELGTFEENIYKIIVKIKNKSIFSKDDIYINFYEDEFVIGKPEKFIFNNKRIYIKEISSSFSDTNMSRWVNIENTYFIDDIKYLDNSDDCNLYLGRLGMREQYYNVYLDTMINESKEYDIINPVRIELRDLNTFWLLTGYNIDTGDFNGELIWDRKKGLLCNINSKEKVRYQVVNLYRFKEEEYV